MFQLPSFFKIRLVALVVGFFILFWLIGFTKWCLAYSVSVSSAISHIAPVHRFKLHIPASSVVNSVRVTGNNSNYIFTVITNSGELVSFLIPSFSSLPVVELIYDSPSGIYVD